MNKIVLLNVRDLATDEKIEPQVDYGIFLIAQRISEEKEDQDSDDNPVIKYRLKVDRIDQVINLKTKEEVKAKQKMTSSQRQRLAVERELGTTEYDYFMKWLLAKIPALCDEYKETL